MEHDAPEAGEAPPAALVKDHVHVGAEAVQREQVDHAEAVPVILLAQHIAVHAENAHIAVLQGVVVHVDHRAVADGGGHGVALYADGQLRTGGHVAGDGQQLVVLAEYRRGKAGGGRGGIERDRAILAAGGGGGQVVGHLLQGVHQRADGLASGQRQLAVFRQEAVLLVAVAGGSTVAAPVQVVGIGVQRVKKPQQHALLGRADARFVVAHGGHGHTQLVRQLLAGQPQLLAPAAHLLSKGHEITPLDKVRHPSTGFDSS